MKRERSPSSRWSWLVVLGGVGLGCDDLRPSSEPAEVAAKVEPVDAKAEPKAALVSEAKAEASAKADVRVEAKAAHEPIAAPPPPAEPAVAPASPPLVEPPAPAVPATPTVPVVPPEVTSPAGSTSLAALPAAPPSDTAFSEKMQRRLRSTLREQHDARTQLAASVAVPHTDGSVTVLALYEYSEYEACVGKSDGSPEARKACANRTDDNERVLAALRKCTGRGLVRAHFGPPPKSQPAYGGELVVEATRPLSGGCTVSKVQRFAVDDVDGDGQVELALDVVSKTPQTKLGTHGLYDPADPLQDTVHEWQASDAAREGIGCVDCHMPWVSDGDARHRSHRLVGAGDPALVREAILASATARVHADGLEVTITLAPGEVGHRVPTGDMFRRLRVAAWNEGSEPVEQWLGREFALLPASDDRGFRLRPAFDDRVPAPGDGEPVKVRLLLPGVYAREARWSVELHRMPPTQARARGLDPGSLRTPVAEGLVRIEPG